MTEQELQEIYELLKKSRLNPQWCDTCVPYYENGVKAGVPSDPGDIVVAIEEAKVARRFAVTDFIEQMREWLPMAFHKEATEDWEKYKRRLSKSISEEKSLWRHGKKQDIVSLREMWAKQRYISLNQAKMERIYAIAFQGLLANLIALKQEIEKEKESH